MNSSPAVEQRVLPAEIQHGIHWLQPLLQSAHPQRHSRVATFPDSPSSVGTAIRLTDSSGLRTLVAVRPEQLQAADQLVQRRYAWRGYQVALSDDREAGLPGSEGQPVTLLAEDQGKLLGTVTVRPDSPQGLLAEQSYRLEIERLRREGRRVGELVKLAVEEGVDWKAALDALVQSAYLVTHVVHALTDVLIEVNPRHVAFYRRVFGFVVAAGERLCARAGAPAVLMRLDLAQFGRRLELAVAA